MNYNLAIPEFVIPKAAILFSTAIFVLCGQPTHASESFFANLRSLCGERFVGTMTFPVDGQDSFKGKPLTATIATCSAKQISIPFQVGEDTSRTWLVSRVNNQTIFKHDHRHKDGSLNEITNYGGTAQAQGTALSQTFPADEFTQKLIPEAATNQWSLTFSEDKHILTYHLERHQMPRFTAVLERVSKTKKEGTSAP